jgi:hypothetical protein
MQLTPLTAYYIRKLLRLRSSKLKFVVAPGAAFEADTLADLNVVLKSLYLEDLEVNAVIQELETLVNIHQHLISECAIYANELTTVEQKMFWLLGFKTK